MFEKVVLIVWVEERLDSIQTLEGRTGNVIRGIRKHLWTTLFYTSKSIIIFMTLKNDN